jgi:hypothetical protein
MAPQLTKAPAADLPAAGVLHGSATEGLPGESWTLAVNLPALLGGISRGALFCLSWSYERVVWPRLSTLVLYEDLLASRDCTNEVFEHNKRKPNHRTI